MHNITNNNPKSKSYSGSNVLSVVNQNQRFNNELNRNQGIFPSLNQNYESREGMIVESKTTIKISTKRTATDELDRERRTKENRPNGYKFNELHKRNIAQPSMESVDSADIIEEKPYSENKDLNSDGKKSKPLEVKNQNTLRRYVIKFKNPDSTLLVFSKPDIVHNHILIHLFESLTYSLNGNASYNTSNTQVVNFVYLMNFARTCKINLITVIDYIKNLVGEYTKNGILFNNKLNINDSQDGIPLLLLKGFHDKNHSYFQYFLKNYWERLEQGYKYSFKNQCISKQLEDDFENITVKNFKRILAVMNLKATEVLSLEERWLQIEKEDFKARCMHIRHLSMLAKNGFFESKPAIFEEIIKYASKNVGVFMAEYLVEMILNLAKAGLLKDLTEDKIDKDFRFLMKFLWKDSENSMLEMISELAHLGFFKGKIVIPLQKNISEIYTHKITNFIETYEQKKSANRELLVKDASETFKHLNSILFNLGSKSEIMIQFGKAKLNKITQNRFTENQWARIKLREILIANIASYDEIVFWKFIKDAVIATQQKHDSTYNAITVDMIIDFCNKDLINLNNVHNLVPEIKALQIMASWSEKKDQANTLLLTLKNKGLLNVIREQIQQHS